MIEFTRMYTGIICKYTLRNANLNGIDKAASYTGDVYMRFAFKESLGTAVVRGSSRKLFVKFSFHTFYFTNKFYEPV